MSYHMFKMRTLFLSVLVILALIPLVPSILSDPLNQPLGDFTIPAWVKNTADWWSDDKIPDSSFIEAIVSIQSYSQLRLLNLTDLEKCISLPALLNEYPALSH